MKATLRRIKDFAPLAEAEARAERLKPLLEAASLRLNNLTMRASRTQIVAQYLGRGQSIMPAMTEIEFDKLALEVAAEGEVSEALAKKLRAGAPPVPFFEERDSVSTITEINDVARSVELLKRASALQGREIARQKNLAIGELYDAVRGERGRIADKIARAVLALAAAVLEEKAFIAKLSSQDEAVLARFSPQPFPIALESDSVCRYLSLALGISETEVRSRITDSRREPIEKAAVQ